jgi:hypothetical protein
MPGWSPTKLSPRCEGSITPCPGSWTRGCGVDGRPVKLSPSAGAGSPPSPRPPGCLRPRSGRGSPSSDLLKPIPRPSTMSGTSGARGRGESDSPRRIALSWRIWRLSSTHRPGAIPSRPCSGPARAHGSWPRPWWARAIGSATRRSPGYSRRWATACKSTARPGRGLPIPTGMPSSSTSVVRPRIQTSA